MKVLNMRQSNRQTLTGTFLPYELRIGRRMSEHVKNVRYVKSEFTGECKTLGQPRQRGADKHAHYQFHSCCKASLT